MDLINNRARDIAALALDGLYERSKAISSNTANALTPNYQRKEVSFEQSLQNIIKNEEEKEQIKAQNSIAYQNNPKEFLKGQSPAQIAFLNSEMNKDFIIDVQTDTSDPIDIDGNNVNLEVEMMDETRTGAQYQVIANLISKSYEQLRSVITSQS